MLTPRRVPSRVLRWNLRKIREMATNVFPGWRGAKRLLTNHSKANTYGYWNYKYENNDVGLLSKEIKSCSKTLITKLNLYVHFYQHLLKKKSDNIKNSSWLNCIPIQNNMKNCNLHFLVKAYFCNTYHFLQNSSIFCFPPLFYRKTFLPWLHISAFWSC